jgi:hypothetical protein
MGLILPVPTVRVGPLYASDIDTAFTSIDTHNHTPGGSNGVQIPTAGLNINAPLSFNGNAITGAGGLSMTSLASLATPRSLYFVGRELYVTDGTGAAFPLTSGGNVNVSGSGNITGMGATTAAVTYLPSPKTFVFTSNASVAASLDAGSVAIRNAGQYGVIVQAAAGMTSTPYLTLPTVNIQMPTSVPGTGSAIVTLDSSGNLGSGSALASAGQAFVVVNSTGVPSAFAGVTGSNTTPSAQAMITANNSGVLSSIQPDGTVLSISGATTLQVNGNSVGGSAGNAKIAAATITNADISASAGIKKNQIATVNSVTSTICTSQVFSSATPTQITSQSVSFTPIAGHPVYVCLRGASGYNGQIILSMNNGTNNFASTMFAGASVYLYIDGVEVARWSMGCPGGFYVYNYINTSLNYPINFSYVASGLSATAHTFAYYIAYTAGVNSGTIQGAQMDVVEQ